MAGISEYILAFYQQLSQQSWSLTLAVLLLSVIILLFAHHYATHPTKTRAIPPGPIGLPIFGLLPWIFYHRIYKYASDLSGKYGKIVTLCLGKRNLIIINDYELSKEFSLNGDFQGRGDSGFMHEVTAGLGIVNAEGSLWKHQRRFTLQALKDAGMGKLRLQDKIIDELVKSLAEIDRKALEGPVPIHQILEKCTCNIVSALAFGKQYDYDDPELDTLMHGMNYNFKKMGLMQLMSAFWFYPLVRAFYYNKIAKNTQTFKDQGKQFIKEHRSTLDPSNPRDLIDLYLIEMDKKDEEKDESDKEYYSTFFEDQLIRIIVDLFGAGTETSSTTVRWALLYMLHHPEIQEKIQKELDEVVGTERVPNIEDKASLPYTVATIQEVERLASIAPMSLQRSNPKSAQFHGYKFKPRQLIHMNLYAIHRDPKLWPEPEKFSPERFLGNDGKVNRPAYLMPFGSGRRVCPGEALAKAEVFLIFTTLVHKYKIKPVDSNKLPTLQSVFGFVNGPVTFDINVEKRF